jgi:hypothetical protein
MTKECYYTYGEDALLKERVSVHDIIRDHGHIVAVSPNGQIFLLCKYGHKKDVVLSVFKISQSDFKCLIRYKTNKLI